MFYIVVHGHLFILVHRFVNISWDLPEDNTMNDCYQLKDIIRQQNEIIQLLEEERNNLKRENSL